MERKAKKRRLGEQEVTRCGLRRNVNGESDCENVPQEIGGQNGQERVRAARKEMRLQN